MYVIPDDILGVISEFSKPLKRRTVSTFWEEKTEKEMVEYIAHQCLIQVKKEIDENDFTYDGNVELLETDYNTIITEDTPIETEIHVESYEDYYIEAHVDGMMLFCVQCNRQELYEWSGKNIGFDLKDKGVLVTQLIDKDGKVIRII